MSPAARTRSTSCASSSRREDAGSTRCDVPVAVVVNARQTCNFVSGLNDELVLTVSDITLTCNQQTPARIKARSLEIARISTPRLLLELVSVGRRRQANIERTSWWTRDSLQATSIGCA